MTNMKIFYIYNTIIVITWRFEHMEVGSLMFFIGFVAVLVVGGMKIYVLSTHVPAMLVGVNPYFHIAILMMILGCMLFLAGFLAELVLRNSPSRNDYLIKEEI